MKNTLLIFLAILLSFKTAIAQTSLSETEKLASTAKFWGFLKYYHPNVADGKFNWDEELFNILPKVKRTSTKEELSDVYLEWLDKLGKVKECKKCELDSSIEHFDKNFDLSWINDDRIFTADLSEKLRFIEKNRHQGKKHYVSSTKIAKNIEVINEIVYKDFNWSNENLRLLSLFRYWNTIEYFFPYKYQTDIDWDEVLITMIPKFLNPETEREFYLASLELIVSIDDGHATFFNDKISTYFGKYWIPAQFRIVDEGAILKGFYNDSLARVDDLMVGDIITKINGNDALTLFDEHEKYISGSNISKKKNSWYSSIFNGPSDSVEIEFIRNNITASKTIKRYLLSDMNIKSNEGEKYKLLEGNIGYVNTSVIERKDIEAIFEELKNAKAIILDVRSYPKESVYQSLSKYISSESNTFYRAIYPDLNYPGKFIWKEGSKNYSSEELQYSGKVILLTNENSISHAEFMTMCLQAGDNVTTIGRQTSGADGNVSTISMVDGYKTRISGIGIFYPDGTETQRKGVKIDIEVNPTTQGIIAGKDEILERAIEFVNGGG